jgi:hypothetical protein
MSVAAHFATLTGIFHICTGAGPMRAYVFVFLLAVAATLVTSSSASAKSFKSFKTFKGPMTPLAKRSMMMRMRTHLPIVSPKSFVTSSSKPLQTPMGRLPAIQGGKLTNQLNFKSLGDAVSLNPQPLPPKEIGFQVR